MKNYVYYVYYYKDGKISSVYNFEVEVKDCKVITVNKEFKPSEYEVKDGKLKKLKVGLSTESKTKVQLSPSLDEKFLFDTDWKVTRHRDQIELGEQTSLSNEDYLKLQRARQLSRENIKNKGNN